MNDKCKLACSAILFTALLSPARRRRMLLLFLVTALALVSKRELRAQLAASPTTQQDALHSFLMEREAEVMLARSAAPPTISKFASVLVLSAEGYEYVARGSNGFECLVQRGWMNDLEDSDYGSPALKSPMCLNAAAVRLYLPLILRRTELARERASRTLVKATIDAEFSAGKFKANESGAMCYMMSKDGFFGSAGPPMPHIMFFMPPIPLSDWGANQPGSTIFGYEDHLDRLSVFILPSITWSDGSPAPPSAAHKHSLVVLSTK